MSLTDDPPDGYWPVYKGESFDLWTPDTGTYYAWADPDPFYACLDREGPLHELSGVERDDRRRLEVATADLLAEVAAVDADRRSRRRASWESVAVSALAKEGAEETLVRGRGGRGTDWGSAVHQAIEAAGRGLEGEDLALACRSALVAHQRPLGDDGEPEELAELVALVEAVGGSEILRRARAARRALFEVPFALPRRPDPEGPIQLVEGVIDLAFQEEDGWVIVDWKTDEVEDPAVLVARKEAYQRQVKLYAEAWQTLTGGRVKEQLVSFLR